MLKCSFRRTQPERKSSEERQKDEGREEKNVKESEGVSEGKPKYPPLRRSCREMDEG